MKETLWRQIADYARWAPSPHNTQPVRLKILNETTAELYFVTERGLRIGDPAGRFTFATIGIFAELLKIAAADKGYELVTKFTKESLYKGEDSLQKVGDLILKKSEKVQDLDPALIRLRQTSRLPYRKKEVPAEAISELREEAGKYSHTIEFRTDARSIRYVIELNKDSLFFDISHRAYREELAHWLRYSKKEAEEKKDGLAMDTMQIPGVLARSFMYQHWIYSAPVLRQISEYIYMKTMKGIATVGWIQGPYRTQDDWIAAGRLMIRLWLIVAKHGLYWQPYGSVITNDEAREKLVRSFKIDDEKDGRNMVWLLLRIGYSAKPPKSKRLPLEEILL